MAKGKAKKDTKEPRFFWITGGRWEAGEFIKHLISLLGGDSDVVVMDHDEKTVESVVGQLREQNLFSNRPRIVIVRGLPEDYLRLSEYVERVNPSRYIVIDAPLTGKIGNKPYSASNSLLVKKLREMGTVLEFPTEMELPAAMKWLPKVAERLGIRFDDGAAESLYHKNLGLIDGMWSDLEKLSVYMGKRTKLTKEDVDECCTTGMAFNVWEYTDAVLSMQASKAIGIIEEFFDINDSFIYEVEAVFGALIYRIESLLMLKDSCPSLSAEGAKEALAGFIKPGKQPKPKYDFAIRGMMESDTFREAHRKLGCPRLTHMLSMLYWTKMACRVFSNDEAVVRSAITRLTIALCGGMDIDSFYASWAATPTDGFGPDAALLTRLYIKPKKEAQKDAQTSN